MQVPLLLKQRHLFFKLKEIQSSKIASTMHKARLARGRVQQYTCAFCMSPFAKAVLSFVILITLPHTVSNSHPSFLRSTLYPC